MKETHGRVYLAHVLDSSPIVGLGGVVTFFGNRVLRSLDIDGYLLLQRMHQSTISALSLTVLIRSLSACCLGESGREHLYSSRDV